MSRTLFERKTESWDGTELFYRAWLPNGKADKALFLFHRGHEHSGRWQAVVDALDLEDVAVFAWDARGHGLSRGERGAAPNFAAVIKDVDAFVRSIAKEHGIALSNVICLGHSLGAIAVAAWVHDYAPPIRAMILATAAFRVRLYVPFAGPMLRLKQATFGSGSVTSYVTARMLTRVETEMRAYKADPLISRKIAVNILLDVQDTSSRLLADAGAINLPTLMLGAGSDWVVDLIAQRNFFKDLSSSIKRMHVFPAARHAIFHDSQRDHVIATVRDFVSERFTSPPVVTNLKSADKLGYTWEEHERLKLNGKPQFAVLRAALKTGGRLSNGLKLGWRTGFDSGLSLDYVYQNQPRGLTSLGRLADRAYLDSPGWKGIRQRKAHLEQGLHRLIDRITEEGREVHILDVAAGAGSYILETMHSLPEASIHAILLDNNAENVEAINARAEILGLKRIEARQADAFDPEAFAAILLKATIGIVSGLYELFPSNDLVTRSLSLLADNVDGYLIYTNQPWHPQIEFIARVLRNREGKPWIMRRRTTEEMDQLVEAAGFEKLEMEIDRWGMFTVSIARRATR
jgi:alpha-beta hydrolase superfamily lysophospholipase